MRRVFRENDPFYVVKDDSYCWWLRGHVVQRGEFRHWRGNLKIYWFKDFTSQITLRGVFSLREAEVEGPLTPLEVLAHLSRQEVA